MSAGNTHLVNVTESDLLDGLVLENLSNDTTVTTADNKNVLGVRVRSHREMSDHLLITVQRQHF